MCCVPRTVAPLLSPARGCTSAEVAGTARECVRRRGWSGRWRGRRAAGAAPAHGGHRQWPRGYSAAGVGRDDVPGGAGADLHRAREVLAATAVGHPLEVVLRPAPRAV